MSAMLTADWCPLGKDTYFRKYEIYCMGWHNNINLDNVVVAAAPYGGPIAVIRDRKKFVKIQGSGKPIVSIFSASGSQISSFMWDSGTIIQLGWSSSEELLCVRDDGSVLIYDIFGTYQHTFGIGQEAQATKVIDAKIFNSYSGTGIAVLTSAYRIFLVNSVKDPKLRKVAEVDLSAPPSSWAVISEDRQTRVLVAKEKDLYLLLEAEDRAQPLLPEFDVRINAIVEMAVSQNNRHIALFTDTGHLWMGSADLRKRYYEFDTKYPSRPTQLVWCGTEAVIGNWDNILLVVGRQGNFINYSYDSNVFLVPEIDGVRVLGNLTQDMIQKVPPVVQQIFRINSTDPGSYLLEASKQFQKRSHRADEYIRLVKDKLQQAVQQCIEAAGYEFEPTTQKMLMRAAQLGKGFIFNLNPDFYVKMCRILRVLNAVRDYKIGIPITYVQLQVLGLPVLLDRLVVRHHYYLAIEIAKHLKMPPAEGATRILAHWACYKVKQTQLDNEQVAKDIKDKLGYAQGMSYSEIANKAAECGRPKLAIKLMDYEPRASCQVPLLLTLGEREPALRKAIDSGDTDLVHSVLLNLRDNMPLGDFQLTIRKYPVAQALYMKYCRDNNRETLRDIYVQEDDFNAQAACFIRESYDPKNTSTREASLAAARDAYRQARNDLGHQLCDEQLKLLKYQRTLEDKFHRNFVGKSLHDTVYLLLSLQEVKLADKLRQEYRVPDRRYWWLRIMALAELNQWTEMDKFSKSKKSPIGYEPFVDVCLKHGKKVEAQKYMPKVKDELKVKYYMKAGLFEEAVQVAFEQKDTQALLYIQSKCVSTDKNLVDKITSYIVELGSKK